MEEVRVNYIFHNDTGRDVDALVTFPMPDIGGFLDANPQAIPDQDSDNFMDFTAKQDGKPVPVTLQQRAFVQDEDVTARLKAAGIPLMPYASATAAALNALPSGKAAAFGDRFMINMGDEATPDYTGVWTLKSAYVWKAHFPAGKDVTVSHTYRPSVGGTVQPRYLTDGKPNEEYPAYQKKYCMEPSFLKASKKALAAGYYESRISYVLSTGANWNGPIRDFTLTVDKGDKDNYVSFCANGVKKIGPTTFQVKYRDFTPKGDFDVVILGKGQD